VRLESVSYTAPCGESLIDVDLTIPAGRRVAVVGRPGGGKTALVGLLARLEDPRRGRVLLSGVPLVDVPFSSLRRRVVVLPRNDFVLSGTVADNIRLGHPQLSDSDVYTACTELGIADWLDTLGAGLETRIGRAGKRLSAAERQLVALARAHVTAPDLLIVVGGGMVVDPTLRQLVERAVDVAARGRTTIMIGRQLRAAQLADEVIVFDGGRPVERGSHAALVADPNTYYARLHLPPLAAGEARTSDRRFGVDSPNANLR
jgi:ABC-type multidrug transport system fused ATPase/permease subunit